jgi:hypothetical protein
VEVEEVKEVEAAALGLKWSIHRWEDTLALVEKVFPHVWKGSIFSVHIKAAGGAGVGVGVAEEEEGGGRTLRCSLACFLRELLVRNILPQSLASQRRVGG